MPVNNQLKIAKVGDSWFGTVTNDVSGHVHHQQDITEQMNEAFADAAVERNSVFTQEIRAKNEQLAGIERELRDANRKLAERDDTNAAIAEANESLQQRNAALEAEIKKLLGLCEQSKAETEKLRRENVLLVEKFEAFRIDVAAVLDDDDHTKAIAAGSNLHAAFAHALNDDGYEWPSQIPWYRKPWALTNDLMKVWDDLSGEERCAFMATWDKARALLRLYIEKRSKVQLRAVKPSPSE